MLSPRNTCFLYLIFSIITDLIALTLLDEKITELDDKITVL